MPYLLETTMRYFTTLILALIFLLLAVASVAVPSAAFPALAVLLILPLVAYIEHSAKFIGE